MAVGTSDVPEPNGVAVRVFFDLQYRQHRRYWWRGDNRYSLNPSDHTAFNGDVLRLVSDRPPGRALDIGAGEGADAIRLAKLGYQVDALELSAVACEKIERFAREEGVRLSIRNEPVHTARFERGVYDVVVMNGLLHYIENKEDILQQARRCSASSALHVVSLFSTITEIPPEHSVVPVFPDDEGGVVERFYSGEFLRNIKYERSKPEASHPGFADHVHSYLKMIVELSDDQPGER